MNRIMTITEYLGLRKTAGELDYDKTPQNDDAELVAMLDEAVRAYDEAFKRLAEVKSRYHANLSPASRSALEAMGQKVEKDVGRLGDTIFEIRKRIASLRVKSANATNFSMNLSMAKQNLRALQKRADDVLAGREPMTHEQRRAFVAEMSRAELAVAECSR